MVLQTDNAISDSIDLLTIPKPSRSNLYQNKIGVNPLRIKISLIIQA